MADPGCGDEKPPGTVPLLVASGSDDPLSGGGQLLELLAPRYRQAGLGDVTVTVFPGVRHEIRNETKRDEVTADVIGRLRTHLPA